jgi:hypothetical protein
MIENHETQRQTGTGGFGVVIVSSIARLGPLCPAPRFS